jgi:asparagine synthase (glutamine-hydrolysing)
MDGRPVDLSRIAKTGELLRPYGPDAQNRYFEGSVAMIQCAFHTAIESRRTRQPYIAPDGTVLNWDGRLDNRRELLRELRDISDSVAADVSIVAAAYRRWGIRCFAKFKGDWALSIWNPALQLLLLVKDPIGTFPLYYSLFEKQICWSSVLDPLVLLANSSFVLNEEYLAGCFTWFPDVRLTPFTGIHSVPPSCFVRIRPASLCTTEYWNFNPDRRVIYQKDSEYEDHFRSVFSEAVRRRLRSESPVLAELSGGMDSSSIVCMADLLLSHGHADTTRIDTLSFYDDSEPHWNEKPYFTQVENARRKTGCHLKADSEGWLFPEYATNRFSPLPQWSAPLSESAQQFSRILLSQGNRVVLSGIGGDEILGGVPTAKPELADLLAKAQLRKLSRKAVEWALAKRKPVHQLLFEAIHSFLPVGWFSVPRAMEAPHWLEPAFALKHRSALRGYEMRLKLFGPLPSFQENASTLDLLRRQIACATPASDPPFEKRYPYLDQDLIEFVYAIPREQIVRPQQRRSLMRRALAGVVPEPILNRRRKGFVSRGPAAALSASWQPLVEEHRFMVTAEMGIVNQRAFLEALDQVRRGQTIHLVHMARTLALEAWLRHLVLWPVTNIPEKTRVQLADMRQQRERR